MRVKEYIDSNKRWYNNYKTVQDRKIFLYDTLNDKEIKNYSIERFQGSNQIILKKDNKIIYNDDFDKFTPESFIVWVSNIFEDLTFIK